MVTFAEWRVLDKHPGGWSSRIARNNEVWAAARDTGKTSASPLASGDTGKTSASAWTAHQEDVRDPTFGSPNLSDPDHQGSNPRPRRTKRTLCFLDCEISPWQCVIKVQVRISVLSPSLIALTLLTWTVDRTLYYQISDIWNSSDLKTVIAVIFPCSKNDEQYMKKPPLKG